MFVARAEASGAAVDIASDADLVGSICDRLDRLPLAVELAAARTRMMSLTAIDERLDDALQLPAAPGRDADRRQATMTAALDWSHDLLDEEERHLFHRLGIFVGGWQLDAVEHVCAGAAGDVVDVVDVLGRLVDRSLVGFDSASDRYRLLEPVRQYAWRHLAASGDAPAVVATHRRYYRAVARDLNARILSSGSSPTDRAEFGNFRAAIDRALDTGHGRAALTVFVSLGWYWVTTAFWREGVDRGRRALELAGDVDPAVGLLGHCMVAGFLAYSGRPGEAVSHVDRALEPGTVRGIRARWTAGTGRSQSSRRQSKPAADGGDRPFAAYIARSLARYHLLMWEFDEASGPLERAIGHVAGTHAAFADELEIQRIALDAVRGRAPARPTLAGLEASAVRAGLPFYGEDRSVSLAVAGDAARVMRGVLERNASVHAVLRSASAVDPGIDALAAEDDERRKATHRAFVEMLMSRGALRDGLSAADATDTMSAPANPETYAYLTRRRRWTPARFERWLAANLALVLQPSS